MIESVTPRAEQGQHARRVRGIHGIGQADVGDARIRKDFGFAELRAADASGAGLELPLRNLRALVRFGVRPKAHAGASRQRLHRLDVVAQTGVVDGDDWSRKS